MGIFIYLTISAESGPLPRSGKTLRAVKTLCEHDMLDQLGYEIEVVQINEYNRLTIEMYDREVFRCDIKNLQFNMSAEDDPVCQRAVKAVEEAKFRMCSEKNSPGYSSITKGKRELNSEHPIRQTMQTALPSHTELLYEIPANQGYQYKPPTEADDKVDEKVGKVTIAENKNTFMMHQGHGNEEEKYDITKMFDDDT